jgi:hypothetical protein
LITQGFAVVLTAEIRHWKAIDSAASSPELPTLTGEGEEREEKREKKRGERERERGSQSESLHPCGRQSE